MIKKKLFTASLQHVAPHARADALEQLTIAMRQEFPAYWVSFIDQADSYAAVIVSTDVRDAQFEKLDGWGKGWITLSEVK